jgi:hypothetical protein
MSLLLRSIVRLGILLLVVRVLVDMATPNWPGAFRLDPSTSIDAARASDPAGGSAMLAPPGRMPGRPVVEPIARPRPELPWAPPARAVSPVVYLSESTGSPSPSDDD